MDWRRTPISPPRDRPPGQRALERAAGSLWQHGYARVPAVLPAALCDRLSRRIAALGRAGAPPVAVFRDEDAWAAARLCLPVARHFLGPGCRMLPHLWAMALHPGAGGARGWPPHADYQGTSVLEGPVPLPVSLSFWLALSDTGPDNACMHIRPQHVHSRGTRSGGVALPAARGDLLVWRQDLLHWGGRMTRRARGPRISLALEFQNAAFAALAEPLLDPERPPSRAARIRLIGRQRAKYRHLAPAPQAPRRQAAPEADLSR